MPPSLEGRTHYKKVLKRLGKFPNLAPKFWRKSVVKELDSGILDFQLYQKHLDVYWRRATRTWGWNRRDWTQNETTEFFTHYKLICLA